MDDTATDETIPGILPEGDEPAKLLNEESPVLAPEVQTMSAAAPATPPVAEAAPALTPEPELIIPAVSFAPVSPIASTPAPSLDQHAENIQMATKLSGAIEEGKHVVPEDPNPLISKPAQLESWRVFKIMAEFVDGFEMIGRYKKAATFFGSERSVFDSHIYADATALAGMLAKQGFAVITGGSNGIMEAANKGAFEAGGASIGLNIRLGNNQQTNKYVTESMMFEHFFVRKVMLTFASEVYIYFPGGFGTLDEFTEILTLVQTKNIRPIPIILYGTEYWTPLLELFKTNLDAKYHSIDTTDLELYHLVDSVDEAYEYICKNAKSR